LLFLALVGIIVFWFVQCNLEIDREKAKYEDHPSIVLDGIQDKMDWYDKHRLD